MAAKEPKPGDEVIVHHDSPHIKKHKKHKIVSTHFGPYYGLRHQGGISYMPAHQTSSAMDPNAPPNATSPTGATGTGPNASDNELDFLDYIVSIIGRFKKE